MILRELFDLAQREQLLGENPDYEVKPVAWLVEVSEDGRLLAIHDTRTEVPVPGKKKGRLVAKAFLVPREKAVTREDRAFFLFGKSEYVFGIDVNTKLPPEKRRSPQKLQQRFRLFREKVRECVEKTGDEAVRAVSKMLESVASGEIAVRLPGADVPTSATETLVATLPADVAANDLFAFLYAPDIDRLVTDRLAVRSFWEQIRASSCEEALANTSGKSCRCLISGERISGDIPNVPLLKKLPGGTPSGVAIVSFNATAFESYGWVSNANAPIARNAAEASMTALSRLVDPAFPDPNNTSQTLPKWNIRLSDDTVVCYWAKTADGDAFSTILDSILEGDPETVGNIFRSIWYGKPPERHSTSPFYGLTLSGTQGRAIIRDWFETTVENAEKNLSQHFLDLANTRLAPPPKNKPDEPILQLNLLLESIADPSNRRQAGIPAALAARFVNAAFSGSLYPRSIQSRAIRRYRMEIGKESDEKNGWFVKRWNDARTALIKAEWNRRCRMMRNTQKEVLSSMDPTNIAPGYLLGQLMAVLEKIQQEASSGNATVTEKFFSGASARPRSVFVRLLKNCRYHIRKAKDDPKNVGIVILLERLVDEIVSNFDPKKNGFPAFLELDQQGLFILGFHHMRKWLWMSADDRAVWNAAHPDAPGAYLWTKKSNSN